MDRAYRFYHGSGSVRYNGYGSEQDRTTGPDSATPRCLQQLTFPALAQLLPRTTPCWFALTDAVIWFCRVPLFVTLYSLVYTR